MGDVDDSGVGGRGGDGLEEEVEERATLRYYEFRRKPYEDLTLRGVDWRKPSATEWAPGE